MTFSLATCAALLSLLSAALCAPTKPSLQGACADVRISSLELNRMAKIVSVEARNGSRNVGDFSTPLAWIETEDMCDPRTLKHNPGTCIGKLLSVLAHYSAQVDRVAGFQNCSAAKKVRPVMEKLQKDMAACVMSKGEVAKKKEFVDSVEEPIGNWQKPVLCHYTLDRLFSFSILTARVFALGDPSHHAESPAQPMCQMPQ